VNILILIIVAIASFALGRKTVKTTPQASGTFALRQEEELNEMREDAHEALTERTEKRKEKILYLMNNEATHQEELKACGVDDIKKGITTENVRRLLDVSGGTARKYLNELEDENKIKQIGKTGRDVYYTLNA